jgi:ubiquinone biosynthesis protein UbiJ
LRSGEAAIPAAAAATESFQPVREGDSLTAGELAAIKANVDHLQAEVASLKETVARLCKELGVPPLS